MIIIVAYNRIGNKSCCAKLPRRIAPARFTLLELHAHRFPKGLNRNYNCIPQLFRERQRSLLSEAAGLAGQSCPAAFRSGLQIAHWRDFRLSFDPFVPVVDLPGLFVFFEQTLISGLRMCDLAKIFDRPVKQAVFDPGFARALPAKPFQETAGTAF